MQSIWLKNHKDKEQRRKEVLSYRNAFDALREVLLREYRKKDNFRDYSDPNWATNQVAVNEYNAALDDLLKLLELEKE